MGRTKGTYTLTSNIEPKVGAPLDARTIVKLLADLTASNTFEYPYKGMKVFVEENNKSYTLVGSDPTVSTNWIEDNSGGHTIKNPAGTAMTQRSNLQFVDLTVSDDSTNDVTKVENIHVIQSESELDNLPDGLYMLNEDEGTVIDSDLVGYDNTDSGLEAGNVQDAIDEVVDALDNKIDISAKGVANGIAELDSTGKVPSSQLPSFVDDVLEYSSFSAFPATGETGKIYVALDTNKTYRWGGTEYVEISESLALGETSSTAYRGDRGKTAYDHSQLTSGNPHNVTKSEVGLGNVDNTSDSTKKTNFTGSIASGNTGFVTGGDAYTALGGKADKVSSATNGNLAGLNGSGNLTDSGWNGAKDTTSISGNPISISGLKANQLAINPIITFEPIQDLHGQSKPYPAGGGKNIIPMTVDSIKAANTAGTWSGNVYTYNGVTVTIITDNANNIIEFKVNGTCTGGSWAFVLTSAIPVSSGSYYINGNGSSATARLRYKNGSDWVYTNTTGSTDTPITLDSAYNLLVDIYIPNSTTFTNLLLHPMIRLSTVSDATFAPYSNISPISGYDKIEVLSGSDNLFDSSAMTTGAYLNADGTTTSNGQWNITDYIEITESGAIYKILASAGSAPKSCWYNANKQFISSFQQVVGENAVDKPANAKYLRMSVYTNEVPTFEVRNKATSISESLGQTVYKGYLDVRTGLFTVTHKIFDLGSVDWTYYTAGSTPVFHGIISDAKVHNSGETINGITSCYPVGSVATSRSNLITNLPNQSFSWIYNTNQILIKDTSYTSKESFATAITGQKVVYELATPFTIQLTPHEISLLKDYAYVSTNGTSIALDYHNGELASLSDVAQVGETLNSIDKSVTSGTLTDLVKQGNYGIFYYELKKSGRLVELYLELYNVRYTTLTRIANVPTGFIPAHRKIANIIAADSGTGLIQKGFMRVEVTNTGELQAAFMGSTSENIFADVTLMYYV